MGMFDPPDSSKDYLFGPNVTAEVAKNRMSICKLCPSYLEITKMCKECMCIMPLKTKLKAQYGGKCPLGKWK